MAEELLVASVMRIAIVACALVGCAYQPGSFAYEGRAFPGQRATVGCLDISVDRSELPIGPVIRYQFANRCDRAATIDLAAVAVVGRDARGAEVKLRPYDPRSELHPVALDGRSAGAESIAYPSASAIPQICVDLATLVHDGPPQWRCLGAGAVVGSTP